MILASDQFEIAERLRRMDVIASARPDVYVANSRHVAERIPDGRLALYPGKGHAGVMTHRPAIREIVAFLTADRPGT